MTTKTETKVTRRTTKHYWFRVITASEVLCCLTVRDVERHTGKLPKETTNYLRDMQIGDSCSVLNHRFSIVKMSYSAE